MQKTFRIAALLIAVIMCISFAACGGKDDETTTLADETTVDEVIDTTADAEPVDATADTSPVSDSTLEATILEGETTIAVSTLPGETTVAPTTAASTAKPVTTAEILSYFNKAANAVKTDKPGFTKKTNNVIGKITSSNSLIESLAGKVVPMFPTEGDPVTVAKGASHNSFPVAGQSWASKLDASAVSSATCTESGNFYTITIKMKEEKLNDLPKNPLATKHGTAMTVLSASEVYEQTDKIPSALVKITSFAPTYSGSYITCKINKTTGKMVSATYYFSTIASAGAKVFGGSLTATVPFAIKDNYTIKY